MYQWQIITSTSVRRATGTISPADNALLIARRINNRRRERGCGLGLVVVIAHTETSTSSTCSITGWSSARSLAIIDYSILSILSLVDIGRRARVLDVIVTSYPVSARRELGSPCVRVSGVYNGTDVFTARCTSAQRGIEIAFVCLSVCNDQVP